MKADHVPSAHVVYLLGQVLEDQVILGQQRDAWLAKARSKDAGHRAEALAFVEAARPGTTERLRNAWAFFAKKSVFIWRLPCFEDVDLRTALKTHPTLRQKDGAGPAWTKVRGKKDEVSVRRVRVDEEELQAQVYIPKPFEFERDDAPQREVRDEKVLMRVDFESEGAPLVEVYMGLVDARRALFAFLDWLRMSETPRKATKEQLKILAPLNFTETHVKALAARFDWPPPTNVEGTDVHGDWGPFRGGGKQRGFGPAPVDITNPRVAAQLGAHNDARWYLVKYKHPDGYVEETEVSFSFLKPQAHVLFQRKTSRLAVDWLIEELRKEIGV